MRCQCGKHLIEYRPGDFNTDMILHLAGLEDVLDPANTYYAADVTNLSVYLTEKGSNPEHDVYIVPKGLANRRTGYRHIWVLEGTCHRGKLDIERE